MWDLLNKFIRWRKEKRNMQVWLFSKAELLIFSTCSFSIFMLLSTKSYDIIFILSVATLTKDEAGSRLGHKFTRLNSLKSQNHDSAKKKKKEKLKNLFILRVPCFNPGHLWFRYHNLTPLQVLDVWAGPPRRSSPQITQRSHNPPLRTVPSSAA